MHYRHCSDIEDKLLSTRDVALAYVLTGVENNVDELATNHKKLTEVISFSTLAATRKEQAM